MKQEENDLLLKDLCSRIPYGVRCRIEDPVMHDLSFILNGIIIDDDAVFLKHVYTVYYPKDIKPYLYPMSNMTEEQYKEYIKYSPIKAREYLNENHFDYNGLIEKGLALDATNKNIY